LVQRFDNVVLLGEKRRTFRRKPDALADDVVRE
jgi:hypothetical protein